MNVLIVGHHKSVFIRELISNLCSYDDSLKIDILDLYDASFFCEEKKVLFGKPVQGKKRVLANIQLLKNFKAFKSYSRENNLHYDVCNIHYLDARYWFISNLLTTISSRLVITTYGSDFYRYRTYKLFLKTFYKSADAITFANQQTKDDFKSFYKLPSTVSLRICRFGIGMLAEIQKWKAKSEEKGCFKNILNIPSEKLVVSIGYSSSPNSQQTEIIKELSKLDDSILKKLFVVFPMTYGGYKDNVDCVETQISKLACDYRILKDFLSNEDLAYYRLTTDIMIHLPVSDQLSGTMQENLFAGIVVITGSWLPYTIFDENGVAYYKVTRLEDLPGCFSGIINKFEEYKLVVSGNSSVVWNLSSWEKNIHNWIEVYKK